MINIRTFKSLQEQAYDYLKTQILEDAFQDGTIYSETKLAEEIGISRTPLRNALQRLNQEGFIDIFPSKGFTLRVFSEKDVIELFQIRTAIEGFSASMLARDCNTAPARATIVALDEILVKMAQIIETTYDIKSFYEIDQKFHIIMVDYVENNEFSTLFRTYLYRMKKLALNSLRSENRLNTTLKEHTEILNAIKAGSVTKVYDAILTHMQSSTVINLKRYTNF